jgi:hypothetical protein
MGWFVLPQDSTLATRDSFGGQKENENLLIPAGHEGSPRQVPGGRISKSKTRDPFFSDGFPGHVALINRRQEGTGKPGTKPP